MGCPREPTEWEAGIISAAGLLWRGHGNEQMAEFILDHVGQDCLREETVYESDWEAVSVYLKTKARNEELRRGL